MKDLYIKWLIVNNSNSMKVEAYFSQCSSKVKQISLANKKLKNNTKKEKTRFRTGVKLTLSHDNYTQVLRVKRPRHRPLFASPAPLPA